MLKAGIIGATGMVGQRFITLLDGHPWYEITALAASARSAGRDYADAARGRWRMSAGIPEKAGSMRVLDAVADFDEIVSLCDFVFCAVDMKKEETAALEERFAKAECPVISNNSAHRGAGDVPMLIPEINAAHAKAIDFQRKRLGTKRGFIAVKSNCSIQSYVPALTPLLDFGLKRVEVCTYQAISGAGKTFNEWPEMIDNVIPYIAKEEEKSELEPMKVWGKLENGVIVNAESPVISAQCVRVPVTDGHMAAVFAEFDGKAPGRDEIIALWNGCKGLNLPSAPKQFMRYYDEENYPQTKLHRDLENGMGISVGRLRENGENGIRFISLSHNTLRGAAGGGVLMAELLTDMGYL